MSSDKLTRIAIVSSDKCKPKKCRQECKRSCPVVRMGKLCIEVAPTDKMAFISEELCIGCGICVKKWYVSLCMHCIHNNNEHIRCNWQERCYTSVKYYYCVVYASAIDYLHVYLSILISISAYTTRRGLEMLLDADICEFSLFCIFTCSITRHKTVHLKPYRLSIYQKT
jgi:hypothetical protein